MMVFAHLYLAFCTLDFLYTLERRPMVQRAGNRVIDYGCDAKCVLYLPALRLSKSANRACLSYSTQFCLADCAVEPAVFLDRL